jgi:hypothetical protein
MLSPGTAEVADTVAVVDMVAAVAGSTAVAVVGFTAVAVGFKAAGFVPAVAVVDTLWPHLSRPDTSRLDSSRLDTSWLDMDPVRTLRMGIEAKYTSRVDTTAISGTAVGGITALVRAGYGRTITACTCGPAIKGDGRVGIS